MKRRKKHNGPSPSQEDHPSEENADLMRLLLNMMENQQKQIERLCQIGNSTQKARNVSDFRRLQLVVFSGTEKPLDVKQWLIDTTDLLKAA